MYMNHIPSHAGYYILPSIHHAIATGDTSGRTVVPPIMRNCYRTSVLDCQDAY